MAAHPPPPLPEMRYSSAVDDINSSDSSEPEAKGSSPSYHPLGDPPAMTIMTELILLGPAPCDLHEAFVLRAEGTSIFGDKNRKFSLAYCIVCLLMYQTARYHG